jgi:hypothetical protein
MNFLQKGKSTILQAEKGDYNNLCSRLIRLRNRQALARVAEISIIPAPLSNAFDGGLPSFLTSVFG